MKPSLQLRISQNLTMTPQLQQAIRLLQLSSLELQTEIQNALDSNIMLEVDEGEEEESYREGEQEAAPQEEGQALELKEEIAATDIPGELPVDTAWEDIYDGNLSYTAAAPANGADFYENQGARGGSLAEHLLWQLNLTPINEDDRAIAITIIDFLDKDGYLTCPLEEILPLMDEDMEVGIEELEATLRMIQSLDPPGVGARDIGECLRLQLAQRDAGTAWLDQAREIVNNHMDLLVSHDYNQLMRKLGVGREQLSEVITLIQSLNPRPGNQVQDESIQYIIPDVQVRKDNGRWAVELNTDAMPRLKINSTYAGMIKRADNSPDNSSLKEHLQEARWLIKSLQSRSETLLKVATSIVERQQQFLEHGDEAMKPLVLHDIADELGMHESTVSRVTTNKYMHTPRGIFELKYFFSSHVSTDGGGAASSTAIRAVIRKLVGEENPLKPLSDSKIAGILGEQGINVARRTVAKYREAMSIPPSNERKRLI